MAVVGLDNQATYYLYDTLSGAFIEALPFRGVTFEGGPVNNSGTWTGNLDLTDPAIGSYTNWLWSTAPTRSSLVVDVNGQLVWGGIITGRKSSVDENGHTFEIDAMEGLSYFNQVVQATDYSAPPYSGITGLSADGMPIWNRSFLEDNSIGSTSIPGYGTQPFIWDPMLMGAQLIYDAIQIPTQNLYGGLTISLNGYPVNTDFGAAYFASPEWNPDTPWTPGRTPVANYVSINFPYTSLQTLSAIINQMTAMGYGLGFDIAWDYAYSNGPMSPLNVTINLTFPCRGVMVKGGAPGATGYNYLYQGFKTPLYNYMALDLTRCHAWSFPEDGTSQASTIYATGGNQDIVVEQNIYPLVEPSTPTDNPFGGYPNTSKVVNVSNLNSPNPTAILQTLGKSDLTLFSWPPVAPDITIDMFFEDVGIGQWVVGDCMGIIIPLTSVAEYPGLIANEAFDPRFPAYGPTASESNAIDSIWRIISYKATVGDEGDCLVELTFDSPASATSTGQLLINTGS